MADGTATILGPGVLIYTDEQTKKTLKLTWQNRLDLELYTSTNDDEDADAAAPSGGEASGTDRQQTKHAPVKPPGKAN